METTTAIIIFGTTAGAMLTIIKLYQHVKKNVKEKALKFRIWLLEPTKKDLDRLRFDFKEKDYRDCQTDILAYLVDIENGEKKTAVQTQHICSLYCHYTKNLNGNTYLEKLWNKVMK